MNEDCLYLNIWTKPQSGDKRKAVLIWIYGGGEPTFVIDTAGFGIELTRTTSGFVVGSAANRAYNGALLADEHDVIVVGVKYALDRFV